MCALGSSTVTLCTCPGHTAEDGTKDTCKHIEQVECTEVLNIVRVQHGFAGITIQEGRDDLTIPAEFVKNVCANDGIERIGDKTLHAVGNHDRDLTAQCDNPDCQAQEDEHEQAECGEVPAADNDMGRKVQEVHDTACADSREDGVVHDPGNRLQECCINTERSVVTHFKVLPHCHRSCFTITVCTVTGQTQEQPERSRNGAPETDGETALVIHFPDSDQRDQSHPCFA